MTLQRRIDKARNKLAALLSYASSSLGTDLHDSEPWPTESNHGWGYGFNATREELERMGIDLDHPHFAERDEDEPITTEYDLWYMTNRKAGE